MQAADVGLKSTVVGRCTWVNVDTLTPEALGELAGAYGFHHLDIEDCLSKTQLTKIDEYEGYLFIVLHFPRYNKEKKYSVPVQISFFLGKDFLITVHSGELKQVNMLFEALKNGGKYPERCEKNSAQTCGSSAFLLYRLIHALVENQMRMLSKVLSNIERIEERVFDEKSDGVREVTELRHDVSNLRRIVHPLSMVIHELEKKVKKFSDEDVDAYFNDIGDNIDNAWGILSECKEMIEIYKDTDFILSSERTNKILTLLTIVFTFSIPLTTIGAVWGMNIRLPGSAAAPWIFLGDYTTMWIILGASLIPVIIMYAAFKRQRWL